MRILGLALALGALFAAPVAQAATQCFPGSGTYGAVSVTVSGCTQNFNYNGVPSLQPTNQTCLLTFNKALATSSFTIDAGSVDTGEQIAIATNFGSYSVQASDLTAPSTIYTNNANSVSASAGSITSVANSGSGRFRFISAPPASVTTLSITHSAGGGVALRVCADDAGAAPPPVPTMTEWWMILFGMILAGGAAVLIQRRRMMA